MVISQPTRLRYLGVQTQRFTVSIPTQVQIILMPGIENHLTTSF